MKCGFCGEDAALEEVFTGVEDGARCDCICRDCVLDLYIVMTASAMRPLRPVPTPARPSPPRGKLILLHPRKRQ